jgi:hypothetical protein
MPTIFAQPVDGKSNERRATGGREGGPFRLAGLYRTSFMPTPSSVKSPAARNAARGHRLTAFAVHNQINPLFEAMSLAPLLSRTPKVLGKVLYTPAVNNYYPSF